MRPPHRTSALTIAVLIFGAIVTLLVMVYPVEPRSARIARACDDQYPADVDASRQCAINLMSEDLLLQEQDRMARARAEAGR